MANYFNITLDTLGPASPAVKLAGGAAYTNTALINAALSTADTSTAGYQMKLWGDIDPTWAKENGILSTTATSVTEANSQWLTFEGTKQLKLSSSDGKKTVSIKLRDDVWNESAQVSASIQLDTTMPTVTVTAADVDKISKVAGKNEAAFSFTCDSAFTEYKVKVVTASGAAENTGAAISTANGSTNMSGTGSFTANTPIQCIIKGADLEAASSGDGQKIIKVFAKDAAGNWSV